MRLTSLEVCADQPHYHTEPLNRPPELSVQSRSEPLTPVIKGRQRSLADRSMGGSVPVTAEIPTLPKLKARTSPWTWRLEAIHVDDLETSPPPATPLPTGVGRRRTGWT
jgi:hypothetical protein